MRPQSSGKDGGNGVKNDGPGLTLVLTKKKLAWCWSLAIAGEDGANHCAGRGTGVGGQYAWCGGKGRLSIYFRPFAFANLKRSILASRQFAFASSVIAFN